LNNNVQRLNNLRLSPRREWVDRPPELRAQDRETLVRLGQNPDLEVLLRFLESQKALAMSPLDPIQTNWQQIVWINHGKMALIEDIARLLQNA
jgi:hypothetical protein